MEYENFKISFLANLGHDFDIDQINKISIALDKSAVAYSFNKKTTDLVPYSTSLPKELKEYIVSKKIEGLSEFTLKNKYIMLKKFFLTIRKPIANISANDVRLYLFNYQESRKVSDRTLEGIRVTIHSFFVWCADNGVIEKDVLRVVKPIHYEKKQRRALTKYEMEIVRSACKNNRERAIIEFFASTACRCAELVNVKMSDINLDTRTVILYGKGKKEREAYIDDKCLFALQEYFRTRKYSGEYLFCSKKAPHCKITTAAIERVFASISNKIDGRIGKPITPHVIRHTTATQLVRAGMPIERVQKLLGHENIATTRIYVEVGSEDVKNDCLKYIA